MNRLAMFAAATLFAAAPIAAIPIAATAADDGKPAGWLGIRMQRVDGGLAEALEMEPDEGVLLSQVIADSPAAKAGLEDGDVIVKVDGESVGTPSDLRDAIENKRAGDVVKLTVLRDGKRRTVAATLGEARERPVAARMQQLRERLREVPNPWRAGQRGFLGVQTQPLTGGLGEYFGAKDGGALVAEVVEDSPAAKVGLKPGDVIVRFGDEKIGDPEDLRRAVSAFVMPEKVKVTWIREKTERSGDVEIEVREAMGRLETPAPPAPPDLPDMRWTPRDQSAMRDRAHAWRMQADEETQRAVERLQEQMKKLEEQIRKLERKVR